MDWTSLIAQAPIIAAFIWFSIEVQKRNSEAQDRRDVAYEKRNEALVEAINANAAQTMELTRQLIQHDQRVEARIQVAAAETARVLAVTERKTTPRNRSQQ